MIKYIDCLNCDLYRFPENNLKEACLYNIDYEPPKDLYYKIIVKNNHQKYIKDCPLEAKK
jgi:hypothetical protein